MKVDLLAMFQEISIFISKCHGFTAEGTPNTPGKEGCTIQKAFPRVEALETLESEKHH